MIGENDLRDLCRKFCRYYKPSKNEDVKCMGYLVVREMMEKGKDLSFDRSDTLLDDRTVVKLYEILCRSCSFYDNDCDFAAHIQNAPPCGGFIFLGLMISKKVIRVEDVLNANYNVK
jgi:hypothetical protein